MKLFSTSLSLGFKKASLWIPGITQSLFCLVCIIMYPVLLALHSLPLHIIPLEKPGMAMIAFLGAAAVSALLLMNALSQSALITRAARYYGKNPTQNREKVHFSRLLIISILKLTVFTGLISLIFLHLGYSSHDYSLTGNVLLVCNRITAAVYSLLLIISSIALSFASRAVVIGNMTLIPAIRYGMALLSDNPARIAFAAGQALARIMIFILFASCIAGFSLLISGMYYSADFTVKSGLLLTSILVFVIAVSTILAAAFSCSGSFFWTFVFSSLYNGKHVKKYDISGASDPTGYTSLG